MASVSAASIDATAGARSRRGRGGRPGGAAYAFILPAVVLFVVFVAYPILWVLNKSLLDAGPDGEQLVWLDNYAELMTDPIFWTVIRNMALWGLITIPVQMLIGGVIAYFIETYTFTFRTFFRTMFFLPVVTSVSVISLVWAQIYAPYYGIAQAYLQMVGITMTDSALGNPSTAIYALILVNIWQWTGFSMLMYVAGINNLPSEVLEAARIDGAKGFNLARFVIAPMLMPVTRSLVLLGIIGTLQTFPIVHLMTGGGPNYSSEVFGTYIFRRSFVLGDLHGGATLSVVVLLLALVFTLVQIFVLGSGFGGFGRKEEAE